MNFIECLKNLKFEIYFLSVYNYNILDKPANVFAGLESPPCASDVGIILAGSKSYFSLSKI